MESPPAPLLMRYKLDKGFVVNMSQCIGLHYCKYLQWGPLTFHIIISFVRVACFSTFSKMLHDVMQCLHECRSAKQNSI